MNRHTCIICGKKRYEIKMEKILISSWVCIKDCSKHEDIPKAKEILSLYSQLKHINNKHLFTR